MAECFIGGSSGSSKRYMTKEEFDGLFLKVKHQLLPKSEEEIVKRLSQYTKDVNKINLVELATYLQTESIKYTNDLIYMLLSEIVVEK